MDDGVPHQQLHYKVTEQLRAEILNGKFKPGEWLRQQQIAAELGVSQMPVREALKELAAEGLVEHLPYRGVRVLAFTTEDVVDLYAHRAFLEGMAARFTAQQISAEELTRLWGLQMEMEANNDPEQIGEYRRLNRLFHQVIFSASRRVYLSRTLNQMWASFPTMLLGHFQQTVAQSLPERDLRDREEHRAIIRALEQRDGALAERLVQEHIENAGTQLIAALQKNS